jgi:prepilin-type processing-associated H-X9-DG protein
VNCFPRHEGKGLNFAFADGHVEFLKDGQWWTIPSATTQWLPVWGPAWSSFWGLLGE